MKQQTYDEWFDNEGHEIVDEILAWADDAPRGIEIGDLIGSDLEEFANEAAYAIYESQAGDYADYLYDEMRDRQLFDED